MNHEYPQVGDAVATVADVSLSEHAYIPAGAEGIVEGLKATDDDDECYVKACVVFGPYLKAYVKTDLLTVVTGS